MITRGFQHFAATLLVLLLLGMASAVQADSPAQSAAGLKSSLNNAFSGWSVTENASHHVTFTVVGKNTTFPGVFDNSQRSLETVEPQLRQMLSGIVDFDHYGLTLKTVSVEGPLGLIIYRQSKDGYAAESEGIRCVFNRQGKLVFVKFDLLELSEVATHVRIHEVAAWTTVVERYAPNRIEQAGSPELVIAEGDDGLPHFAYAFLTETRTPPRDYKVYVDAASGNIVRELDITDEVNSRIGGVISAEWENLSGVPANGPFPGGSYVVWYQYDNVPDPVYQAGGEDPMTLDGLIWMSSDTMYANDTGYYLYNKTVGDWQYYFKFELANDIYWSEVDTTTGLGDYVRVSAVPEVFTVTGKKVPKFTLDFDWDQFFTTNGIDLYGSMNVVYRLKAMHSWYEGWLDRDLLFTRRPVRTGVDLGGQVAGLHHSGTLEIDPDYEFEPQVICHEMAHAVAYFSIEQVTWQLPNFWDEGQAYYFASSYQGVPPWELRKLYYDAVKCMGVYWVNDVHIQGLVQTWSWYDMAATLGSSYVDSLVFYSAFFDITSQGDAMRSLLMVDDDDGDLTNGTPNFDAIVAAYGNQYIGPFLPQVFLRDSNLVCTSSNGTQDELYQIPGQSSRFEIIDTYCFDSLVWNFGDGSDEVNGFAPEHAYSECGEYDLVCKAYHDWGVNVDTLPVIVTANDMFYINQAEGSDDYRFQMNLSLTNAFDADTLIVPIILIGEVDMGYDSVSVLGTRLDGWDVVELANNPEENYVVLQFTGLGSLPAGSGVVAEMFFTAYTAPQIDDYTLVRVASAGGYEPLVTHGWEYTCGLRVSSQGKYTLRYFTGDVNQSGFVSWEDYQYLAAYLFEDGDPPVFYWSGDVDCSSSVDILDVTYLYNYLDDIGPAPCGNAYVGQYEE